MVGSCTDSYTGNVREIVKTLKSDLTVAKNFRRLRDGGKRKGWSSLRRTKTDLLRLRRNIPGFSQTVE